MLTSDGMPSEQDQENQSFGVREEKDVEVGTS